MTVTTIQRDLLRVKFIYIFVIFFFLCIVNTALTIYKELYSRVFTVHYKQFTIIYIAQVLW